MSDEQKEHYKNKGYKEGLHHKTMFNGKHQYAWDRGIYGKDVYGVLRDRKEKGNNGPVIIADGIHGTTNLFNKTQSTFVPSGKNKLKKPMNFIQETFHDEDNVIINKLQINNAKAYNVGKPSGKRQFDNVAVNGDVSVIHGQCHGVHNKNFVNNQKYGSKTKYKKQYDLGKGAVGQVFLATNTETGENVAIKKMSIQNYKSIITEIGILQKCNYKFIVSSLDGYMDNNWVYLVLEYCDGGSIDKMQGKFNKSSIKLCAQNISYAMKYIHGQNPMILHRDIKPANILYSRSKNVFKLTDFGAGKDLQGTAAKTYIGTVHFIAPEVRNGKWSDKADVYSFGVTLLYLIFCSQLGSKYMYHVIMKCVDHQPHKRYSSSQLVQYFSK
eukprot:184617_1